MGYAILGHNQGSCHSRHTLITISKNYLNATRVNEDIIKCNSEVWWQYRLIRKFALNGHLVSM